MKKTRRSLFAWAVGWLICMIAMTAGETVTPFQLAAAAVIAAFASSLVVGIAFLVGFVNKIRQVGQLWRRNPACAAILIVSSLFILIFGSAMGVTERYENTEYISEGDEHTYEYTGLRREVAWVAYFVLIYSLVNWPLTNDQLNDSGCSGTNSRC